MQDYINYVLDHANYEKPIGHDLEKIERLKSDLGTYLSNIQHHTQSLYDLAEYDIEHQHSNRDIYGNYPAEVAVAYHAYVTMGIFEKIAS